MCVYRSSRMLKTGPLLKFEFSVRRVPVFKNVEDRSTRVNSQILAFLSLNEGHDGLLTLGLYEDRLPTFFLRIPTLLPLSNLPNPRSKTSMETKLQA